MYPRLRSTVCLIANLRSSLKGETMNFISWAIIAESEPLMVGSCIILLTVMEFENNSVMEESLGYLANLLLIRDVFIVLNVFFED